MIKQRMHDFKVRENLKEVSKDYIAKKLAKVGFDMEKS